MRLLWTLTVIAVFVFPSVFGAIPSNIHKCGYGEYPCIRESFEKAVHAYYAGEKEINLIPFDPLHLKSLKLEKNPQSPVNIELSFKDVDVTGLGQSLIKRLKGFTADLNEGIEVELFTKKIILKGPYSVNGNVLILPIVGKGNSEIVLENVDLSMKTKNRPIIKNGKQYLEFESMKLEIKPKRVQFYLENLFNGNKELGDNMNKFINENWSEIFSELQPAIAEAFSLIIKHILSTVFTKTPYEEFFNNA